MTPEIHPDIPYAAAQPPGSRGHLLDLYRPPTSGDRRPLLIVCGGSGWMGDDGKDYAAELAPHFVAAGYVVAGVSTRSSRQARFPAQVHDVKAAIRWLRAHAGEFGIDPRRVAVLGDSSGGWTAAMAGLTAHVPELAGDVGVTGHPSDVQAVVDLYGPTDFRRMDTHMLPGAYESFNETYGLTTGHDDPDSPESALLGVPIQDHPEKAGTANPITYVTGTAPPFLIAHGQADMLVPPHQSELLYAALEKAGVPAVLYSVPGAGHAKSIVDATHAPAVVTATGGVPRAARPTLDTIDAFLRHAFGR